MLLVDDRYLNSKEHDDSEVNNLLCHFRSRCRPSSETTLENDQLGTIMRRYLWSRATSLPSAIPRSVPTRSEGP